MIHGHFHEGRSDVLAVLRQLPRVMNASVDINGFRPVTLRELIKNNQVYYQDPARGGQPKERKDGKPSGSKGWKADFRPLPNRAAQEMNHD